MKKLITFALAFCVVTLFAGCSDPKGGEGGKDASIIGKWEAVSETGREIIDGKETDKWSDTYAPGELTITFSPNGTGVLFEEGSQNSFTYTVSGRNVTMTAYGEMISMDIRKLTDKNLELYAYEDDGDGTVYETTTYFVRK